MARKGPTRLELRRQHETAEAQGEGAAAPKAPRAKKAAGEKPKKPPARKKSKERPVQRKKLEWVVFSPSMKEEGRFAYDQRAEAEERLEALKLKHKKPYFIQAAKVPLEGTVAHAPARAADEPARKERKPRAAERAEEDEDDAGSDDDDD